MTVSEKQLKANKKNAQKGGVKTPEGKAIVKYNALKHGLLTPTGTLEEMLVEKVAVAYRRLSRAYRYEVGLIRKELDTATDDFYSKTNYKDEKI